MQHRMSRAQLAWLLTDLYYECLNEDDAFRDDLAALFSRLEALGAPYPFQSAVWQAAQCISLDELEKLAETFEERAGIYEKLAETYERLPETLEVAPIGPPYRLASSIRREVEAFLSRWPLPGRIWEDLRFSYALYLRWWRGKGERPWLQLGPIFQGLPTPGLPVVVADVDIGDRRLRLLKRHPWIFPSHPLPFLYHPLWHDRNWLEEQIEAICKEIRESILAQAQVYEEEVEAQGWGRLPPRLRQKAEEAMRRLYLRVMKGYTWGQIAAYTGCDKAQARRQVRYYARLIGLPLPKETFDDA